MSKETVLYAVRVEDEDWQEEIITTNASAIDAAKKWAMENGFNRFRIATFEDDEKPDFAGTVNP